MKINLTAFLSFIFAIFFISVIPVFASTNFSIESVGGYSGNLFADSFSVANYYFRNSISAAYFRPGNIAVKGEYSLSYLEYDTDNLINNFYHQARISIFDRRVLNRFKWTLSASAALKDYTDQSSTYNNSRYNFSTEISYYLKPSLRLDCGYRLAVSEYENYDILRNIEHKAEISLARTFRTKTTLTLSAIAEIRSFSADTNLGWAAAQTEISQSIDLKTGVGVTFHQRWSSDQSRPLSSFYIISGVTSYLDPWDGSQMEARLTRILPYGLVSKTNFRLWNRNFSYDQTMQSELPWLSGRTGRNDRGWSVDLNIRRQFNLKRPIIKSAIFYLNAGYLDNNSDDPYYQYRDSFANIGIRINIL